MRIHLRLAAFTLAGLLLAACSNVPAGAAASVGDQQVPTAQLARLVQAQANGPSSQMQGLTGDQRTQAINQLQDQVLTTLVRIQLMEYAAKQAGIEVTKDEVDQRWQQEADLQQNGEEGLRKVIGDLGLTEDEARAQLRAAIIQQKLQDKVTQDIQVSEDELRQAYEQRKDQYQTVTASHILVDSEDLANEIKQKLDNGADFAALAKQYSQDPGSAQQGGSLGTQPKGTFVPEFEQAIWSAKPGEIVGPVQTQYGWHIIKVESFQTKTFSDVRDSLEQELKSSKAQQAFTDELDQLLGKAEVDVNSRFGTWDPQSISVVPPNPLVGSSSNGVAGIPGAPLGGSSGATDQSGGGASSSAGDTTAGQ